MKSYPSPKPVADIINELRQAMWDYYGAECSFVVFGEGQFLGGMNFGAGAGPAIPMDPPPYVPIPGYTPPPKEVKPPRERVTREHPWGPLPEGGS